MTETTPNISDTLARLAECDDATVARIATEALVHLSAGVSERDILIASEEHNDTWGEAGAYTRKEMAKLIREWQNDEIDNGATLDDLWDITEWLHRSRACRAALA